MGLRDQPGDLAARVALLEAYVRRVQSEQAIAPLNTRYLYDARGQILFAVTENDPQPLDIGPDDTVLTAWLGLPAWRDPDRVRQSLINGQGDLIVGLAAGQAAILPPGVDGQVLTIDSADPLGMGWR